MHPHINTRSSYLAKINDELVLGQFSSEWFGLSFWDAINHTHHRKTFAGLSEPAWVASVAFESYAESYALKLQVHDRKLPAPVLLLLRRGV